MRYTGLKILLSCHGLEDFPVYQKGDEAASLLANWTAMWHPVLVHVAASAPSWARIDDPPQDAAGLLLLVPLAHQHDLQTGFAKRIEEEGGRLINGETTRDAIEKQALDGVTLEDGSPAPAIDADIVADFYALGYCFLQIQVLTRHMRYSSNLDEVYFHKQVIAAADAAVAKDESLCRELLQSCFDVLAEERNHFYPVDAFLMDVTLVANTTLGKSLERQLNRDHKQNLMMSAEDVELLEANGSSALPKLRDSISQQQLEIVGGNYAEIPFPLMSHETIFRQFERSVSIYERILDARPHVFGRRRFGLGPALPQVMKQFGFRGAIHVSLDEGKFPEGMQAKTLWEGNGDDSVEALARVPMEIDKPESFLNLGIKLGEAMDMDHLAVIWFAHWPDRHCDAFDDLVRCCRYGGALGKFATMSEFFAETESPMHSDRFSAEEYQSPFLKQAVRARHADPVSRGVRFWRRESTLEAINSLRFLSDVLASKIETSDANDLGGDLATIGQEIDHAFELDENESTEPDTDSIEETLAPKLDAAARQVADALPKAQSKGEANAATGTLVINPCSFVQRMTVDVSDFKRLPNVDKPVYAAGKSGSQKLAVVDVPPMGFAWIGEGNGGGKSTDRDPPLVEGNMLRNEFLEAVIDEKSGGILAIHDYNTRNNRISQKLAMRYVPSEQSSGDENESRSKQKATYTEMVADSLEVTHSSKVMGEIVARGKLVDENKNAILNYTATYRLERGSRVLRVAVDFQTPNGKPESDLADALGVDAWNSYVGARFAWNSEASELMRSVQQTREPVSLQRMETSHFLEIDDSKRKTTILSSGIAFFRQRGFRSVDMPMIVRGERSRRFEYGIGVDVAQPLQHAMQLSAPKIAIPNIARPKPDHCWLFHLGSKSVVATWWESIIENGKAVGFRVRLLETMGHTATVRLSAMRPLKRANRVDFLGEVKSECRIEDGKVIYDLARRQFIELEAFWSE